MHKNALFLFKNCKNRPALRAPPQLPYLRRIGALPPDPQPQSLAFLTDRIKLGSACTNQTGSKTGSGSRFSFIRFSIIL